MCTSRSWSRVCSLALSATLLLVACDDEKGSCHANVDCGGMDACVAGTCVSVPADCENVGAIADIWSGPLPGGEGATVTEAHATVDPTGAVHLCWYGMAGDGAQVAMYAKQTAWNGFSTSEIAAADGVPLRCGAITASSDGVPYVLVRSPASVAYLQSGSWAVVPLTGLEGVEAQGAVAGDRAVISLSPATDGGVYLAMSLGFELESQGAYVAYIAGPEIEVLVNGWSEAGAHTVVGHAPQVISLADGTPRAVMDYFGSFDVLFTDQYLGALAAAEGVFARAAATPSGAVRVIYLDHNFNLNVASLDSGEFEPLADLGAVETDEAGNGQVPWEIAVDAAGGSHLLVEDQAQGSDALEYRKVATDGAISTTAILTSSLAGDLPGMQRYALATDLCGRATIATVERNADVGVTLLVVREGR